MAPVIAAALISAAATMAKAQSDKHAAAGQNKGGNYQVDIKVPDSNTSSQPQMQVEQYNAPQRSNNNNSNGAMIDAASGVGKAIIEDKLNNQNNNSISTLGWQASDERLKNIFGDNEDAIKAFAKINAIEFTYNDKAKEIPNGESNGVDDDKHFGVKAQELAENPLTESAVKKDPLSEYLEVDTKELTMANTAIISEICKRILILEKVLGIKVV
jgi:hypothetical protein